MFTKIKDFKEGMTCTGFFLLKRVEIKVAQNSKKFIDMIIADQTGEENAKLWNVADQDIVDFKSGQVMKLRGKVKIWNEKFQFSIDERRPSLPSDNININDFIKSAPYEAEYLYDFVMETISSFRNNNLKLLVGALVKDKEKELMIYPAAKTNHHSIRTGLLYHIFRMLKTAESLKMVYENINLDLLRAGIIVHDLYKIDEMEINELGLVSNYTISGNLLGHISMGVTEIEKKANLLSIDDEIVLLLRHMVLSHHYFAEFGSPVKPMFLEAELLHHIDLIDSRVYDIEDMYNSMEDGAMSEPVWSLDRRRIYKPKYSEEVND